MQSIQRNKEKNGKALLKGICWAASQSHSAARWFPYGHQHEACVVKISASVDYYDVSSAAWDYLSPGEAANMKIINVWSWAFVGQRSSVRWSWPCKQEPDADEFGCFPGVIRMLGGLMNVIWMNEIFWEWWTFPGITWLRVGTYLSKKLAVSW